MDHKYSVSEIDRLRQICQNYYLWGDYKPNYGVGGYGMSKSYREEDMIRSVEEMVRTFMISGTKPEDF